MKRPDRSRRWYGGAGSLILVLTLFSAGGCSSNDDQGTDGAANIAATYGLDRSEFIELKKANKNHKDFEKALLERELDKLKNQGVVVKSATSGKATQRPR